MWSNNGLFCLCAEAPACTLQPASVCTLARIHGAQAVVLGVYVRGYGGSPVPSDG